MKPAYNLSRVPSLPCGCIAGPGIVLSRCEEAQRLWGAFAALGPEHATSQTPEYKAYRSHFERERNKR